jgi:hypothetical protein
VAQISTGLHRPVSSCARSRENGKCRHAKRRNILYSLSYPGRGEAFLRTCSLQWFGRRAPGSRAGASKPLSLNPIGTISRRHLAHFVSAVDRRSVIASMLACYPTRDAAPHDLFAYIEGYYNRQRLHSALGYITREPAERKPLNPTSTKSGEGHSSATRRKHNTRCQPYRATATAYPSPPAWARACSTEKVSGRSLFRM